MLESTLANLRPEARAAIDAALATEELPGLQATLRYLFKRYAVGTATQQRVLEHLARSVVKRGRRAVETQLGNPWRREGANLTLQGLLIRLDPALSRSLAEAAGAKVNW